MRCCEQLLLNDCCGHSDYLTVAVLAKVSTRITPQTNPNHSLIVASVRNVSQGDRSWRPPGYPALLGVNFISFSIEVPTAGRDSSGFEFSRVTVFLFRVSYAPVSGLLCFQKQLLYVLVFLNDSTLVVLSENAPAVTWFCLKI